MPEPITLAALGSLALTEGIKFLYGQAGELLKRWRARRDGRDVDDDAARLGPPAGLLDGSVPAALPDDGYADRLGDQIRDLRRSLADWAEEVEEVVPADDVLLRRVDALRCLLEVAYGQRLTFRGESRPASGPLVSGEIDVETVAGTAAAIVAGTIGSGEVTGRARAGRVEPGGRVTGVEADRIG